MVYTYYKRHIAPIGQGLGDSAANNLSLGTVQLDMTNGDNPRLYYTSRTLGDGLFFLGGAVTAGTGAAETIGAGGSGVLVWAVPATTAQTAYGLGVASTSYTNFSEDFSRIFSSDGPNDSSAQGLTKAESTSWKGFSDGKLKSHYEKHVVEGNEFGNITQNEYFKKAKEFAAESNPNFQETKVGNFNIKYDPETRRVFIGHEKNREIRTFYKADARDADPFQAAVDLAKQLSGK